MATKEYIVALEIGTSKIQGAVGINGYDGTTIIAYAQESVDGFISKGVVRNIDETGRCITNVINKLEEQLGGTTIEKAYISINGLSLKSVKTSVVTEFPEYTKITPYIIEQMALENDESANIPAEYQRIQVITQEYKLGGDPCLKPVGMSVNRIEGNYINIVIKSQFMRQLEESLNIAKVEIADSFTAAKINAEELLSDGEKRDGCALVDIGAETTTVTLYSNGILRSLCVLPIGSANITRDLAAEHISYEDAETLKKHIGYNCDNIDSCIKKELRDNIISARMAEILQNVNHRIKHSNEKIVYAVFTGGGSCLRNIDRLIAENLPGIRMRLASNPLAEFCINNEHKHKSEISAILLGLIKNGKENCCYEQEYSAKGMQDIFRKEKFETPVPNTQNKHKGAGNREIEDDPITPLIPKEKEIEIEEEEQGTKEEQQETKEETKKETKEEAQETSTDKKKKKRSRTGIKMKLFFKKCGKGVNKTINGILNGTMTYVDNATKTEDDVNFDDTTPAEKK